MEVGSVFISVRAKDDGTRRDVKRIVEAAAAGQGIKVKVSVDEQSARRARGSIRNLDRDIRNLQQATAGLQFPVLATGALAAAEGMRVAAGAATALGAGLAPVVGLAATLPGLLAGVGQAGATLALGLSGIKDAVKALGQPRTTANVRKLQEVFDRLSPAAERFARFLFSLRPRLDELRAAAAEGLLPGLESGLRGALRLFPDVRAAVQDTARALGEIARRGGEFLSSGPFREDFRRITKANTNLVKDFGAAGLDLGRALVDVTVAAAPLTNWLGKLVRGWAANLRETTAVGRATGALAGFFRETRTATANLLGILGNLGGALVEVGKAAYPLGRELLASLRDATGQLREFLASTQGREQMREFFDSIRESLPALIRLATDFIKTFGGIAGLTADLGRMVVRFLDAHPAVRQFVAALLAMSAAVRLLALTKLVAGFTAFLKLMGGVGAVRAMTTALYGLAGGTAAVGAASTSTAFQLGFLVGKVQQLIAKLGVLGTALKTVGGAAAFGLIATGSSSQRRDPKTGLTLDADREEFSRLSRQVRERGRESLSTKPSAGGGLSDLQVYDRLLAKVTAYQRAQRGLADANRATTATFAQQKAAIDALSESVLTAIDADAGLRQAKLNLRAAQDRVNQLIRQGKQGTDEFRQAQIDATLAETSLVRARQAQRRALAEQTKAILGAKDATLKQLEAQVRLYRQAGVKPPKALTDFLDRVRAKYALIKSKDVRLSVVARLFEEGVARSDANKARHLIGRHRGGPVPGPMGVDRDVVPAMLTPGEWVLNRQQVKAISPQVLARLPKFASGGPVGRSPLNFQFPVDRGAAGTFTRAVDRFAQTTSRYARAVGAVNLVRREKQYRSDYLAGLGDPSGRFPGATGFGRLAPNTARAKAVLHALFPGITIGGWRARGSVPGSDHPRGKALDFMTSNLGTGAAAIRWFLGPGRSLGPKYWIWQRQIATAAGGWKPRRYSGPSPHTDHVHMSFFNRGGPVRSFASGGLLPDEPIVGVGLRTGQRITLNENGREAVVPAGGGNTYQLNVRDVTVTPEQTLSLWQAMAGLYG
jgi:hypothetical protein